MYNASLVFFIYVMVFIIAALIICLFKRFITCSLQWYIFNIVWRYTYSIRLFLIEAKTQYRGKNLTENILWKYSKFKVTLYIRLFPSASCHQALAGSAPRLSTRGTSELPQQTTTLLFCGWCKNVCLFKQKLRPILRWLCWFKSSGYDCRGGSRVASSVTQ